MKLKDQKYNKKKLEKIVLKKVKKIENKRKALIF